MEDNPISQTDNPTAKIFDHILGLKGTKKFRVSELLNLVSPEESRDPELWLTDLKRINKQGIANSIGKMSSFKSSEVGNLISILKKRGMFTSSIDSALRGLSTLDDNNKFYYNSSIKALYFGREGTYSALPLQSSNINALDMVHFGNKSRGANLITKLTTESQQTLTWTDAYYIALNERLRQGNIKDIHKIITKDILKARVGNLGEPSKLKPQQLHINKDIIFFDLETTTANVNNAEIVQLGYKKLKAAGGIEEGVIHIMPKGNISHEAATIHKLTKDKLAAIGAKPFEAYATQIQDLFRGAVVGGYNVAAFDIPILNNLLGKEVIGKDGVIDVYQLYKKTTGVNKPHLSSSLSGASRFHGINASGAHDAKQDIRMTISLLEDQMARFPQHLPISVTGLSEALLKEDGIRLNAFSPSLKSLLQSGPRSRGKENSFTTRSAGLKQVMVGDGEHPLFQQILKYREAKMAMTQIGKSSGKYIDRGLSIWHGLPNNFTSVQAMQRIREVQNSFYENVPAIFAKLGLNNAWPLTKAEYLFDKPQITLPTKFGAKLFSGFTEGMLQKGAHQFYKLANLSPTQRKLLGGIDNPFNTTPEFQQVTKGVGMPIRVAVLDFDSALHSRSIFGESGAFMTEGSPNKFANTFPIGSVVLNAPSKHTADSLEKIFNISLADGSVHNVNKKLLIGYNRLKQIGKTSNNQLTGRAAAYKELWTKSGNFRNVLKSMAFNKATLSSVNVLEGKIVLDFISSNASVPSTLESVIGLRRFTMSKMMQSHSLYKLGRALSEQGVDTLLSAEELAKMHPDLVKELRGHSSNDANLLPTGAKGVRVFDIFGGIRSDYMGDINPMASARMTPGKMRTLALGSMMQGFADPMDNPVYSAFAKGWAGRGIGFNKGTLDLNLSEEHMARQFGRAITGQKIKLGSNVVKISSGGFEVGNTTLAKLPGSSVDEFMKMLSINSGGIAFKDLEGTILDKRLIRNNGILHLDMGISRPLTLVSGLEQIHSQYIPFAAQYLRLNKGVNKRLYVNKDHAGYGMLKALKMLELNPRIANTAYGDLSGPEKEAQLEFEKYVRLSTTKVAQNLGGKKGLFEKTNTILVPGSVRVRLHASATAGDKVNNIFNLDSIYDTYVSEHELREIFDRRRFLDRKLAKAGGFKDVKSFDQVISNIKKQGFTYAMLSADPVQRPEHQRLVRLKLHEGLKTDRQFGQLNLTASSLLARELERDFDRDAATLHFVEHIGGYKTRNQLAELFNKQQKTAGMFRWIHTADLLMEKEPSALAKLFTGKMSMQSFVSQKTYAHLGYTISRPVDAIMHGLASGGMDFAQKIGLDAPEGLISQVISPFRKDSQRTYVAEALVQNLFQAGVSKGKSSPLLDLQEAILAKNLEIREAIKTGKQIDIRATYREAFVNLLKSTGKNREFSLVRYLLSEKYSSSAIDEMEQSLINAATKHLTELPNSVEALRESLTSGTADVLADYLGGGHALLSNADKFSNSTIMGSIYTVKESVIERSKTLLSKVLLPLAGGAAVFSDSAGKIVGNAVENKMREAAASTISTEKVIDSMSSILKNKKVLISGAVGLGVGMLLGSSLSSNAITPIDDSMPSDFGPQLGNYTNRVKLYGSNMPTSRRGSNPSSIPNVEKYRYNSVNLNMNIKDNGQPFNPQIAQSYMDRIASSDFTY